jgi:hypothetical protein
MSKVVYFTAHTLDGFIADEQNSLDWLFDTPHGGDESSWDDFIQAVGPMCMAGRHTSGCSNTIRTSSLVPSSGGGSTATDLPGFSRPHRPANGSRRGHPVRSGPRAFGLRRHAGHVRGRCLDHRRRRSGWPVRRRRPPRPRHGERLSGHARGRRPVVAEKDHLEADARRRRAAGGTTGPDRA